LRAALAGDDVTALRYGQAKYGVPVRITLPPEQQGRLDTLLAMTVRGTGGASVPLAELVQVEPALREKTRYRKDLLPVTYVIGDMAGGTDSPLYGMFAFMRSGRPPATSSSSRRVQSPIQLRSSGTASGRSRSRPSATWAPPMRSACC
jgi:multidrug efflux pump subunit AcrB